MMDPSGFSAPARMIEVKQRMPMMERVSLSAVIKYLFMIRIVLE